jgi:hypothetical protein
MFKNNINYNAVDLIYFFFVVVHFELVEVPPAENENFDKSNYLLFIKY